MRKITEQICTAFLSGRSRHVANSATDGRTLLLHGNRIAWKGEHNGTDGVFITCAGWASPATRERINGVLAAMGHQRDVGAMVNIRQRDGRQVILADTPDGLGVRTFPIGTDGVAFIAHPMTAKGMAAVAITDPH